MKYVYYGFGGFIGFICGVVINLIFLFVYRSGINFVDYLMKWNEFFGQYILDLIEVLPLLGAVLGIILVKYLFGRELDEERN